MSWTKGIGRTHGLARGYICARVADAGRPAPAATMSRTPSYPSLALRGRELFSGAEAGSWMPRATRVSAIAASWPRMHSRMSAAGKTP